MTITGNTLWDPTLLTPDPARQIAWLVYINGIEVPAISVSVSYGVWQIPQCDIALVPDPRLQRMGAEDRIATQTFYCDYWQDPGNPQFRLMFDGEIVGWSYVSTLGGRSIIYSCVDYIQVFTQLFFFFMSSIDDIAVGTSGERVGINANTIRTAGFGASYPYSLFSQGLVNPDGDAPASGTAGGGEPIIARPIDFVYNIVRAVTKATNSNKTIPGVNFFTPLIFRTRFHKRFIALPFLEELAVGPDGKPTSGVFPILRAVTQDNAIAAIARLSQDIGSSGSIWQMVQGILQTLMMELCMLPTPACVNSDFGVSVAEAKTDPLKSDSRSVGIARGLDIHGPAIMGTLFSASKFNFLTQYFVKPQFLFGLPPACNVYFPSQITSFAYEENYATQPTRTYFNVDNIVDLLNPKEPNSGLTNIIKDSLAVGHPEEANARIRAKTPNGKDILIYPEEFFRGPVIDRRTLPRWFFYLQQAEQKPGLIDRAIAAVAGPPPAPTPTQVTTDNRQVAPGDTERDLYRLYAAHEYHKERYARRTGSVSLAFNPYPVPGFPCAIFDRRSSQMDIFGYITTVRQVMSYNSWQTQVGFSYARTVREVFQLLQRQYELENASLAAVKPEIEADLAKPLKDQTTLNKAAPIGAIAMAPAEPLIEVRDVIQNLDRAEQFYQALFYRKAVKPTTELMAELSATAINREVAATAFNEAHPPTGLSLGGQADNTTQSQVALDLKGRRAVFYYPEILELVDNRGKTTDIQITGIDASTKLKLINIVRLMRASTATLDDLKFIRQALVRPDLDMQRNSAGVAIEVNDDAKIKEFNTLEVGFRTGPTITNLDALKEIQIKKSAEFLLTSYDAANRYNARPICTLEEYISFIGDNTQDGLVSPSAGLGDLANTRSFSAPYYSQIRQYRFTSVPTVAPRKITASPTQTSVDGMAEHPAEDAENATLEGIDLTAFSETRQDWTALLIAYRNDILLQQEAKT